MINTKSNIFRCLSGLPHGSRMAVAFFALSLAFGMVALTACGNPAGGGGGGNIPTIVVTANRDTIFIGGGINLTAIIVPSSSDYLLDWEVVPANGNYTIDTDNNGGLTTTLEVTQDELPGTIRVRATLESDRRAYGEIEIKVIAPPFTVERIDITPVENYSETIFRDQSAMFFADVVTSGDDTYAERIVSWTLRSHWVGEDRVDPILDDEGRVTHGRVFVSAAAPPAGGQDRTFTLRATSLENRQVYKDITITVPVPVINNIEISHPGGTNNEAFRGGTIQFTANVEGNYNPPQGVTWYLQRSSPLAADSLTSIHPTTGVLTVGSNEPEGGLTVRAVSNFDGTESNEITMTVAAPPPIHISSLAVNTLQGASPLYVHRGTFIDFSGAATFTGFEPTGIQVFSWSIVETAHHETGFDPARAATSRLTISPEETLGELTVRAVFHWGGNDFDPQDNPTDYQAGYFTVRMLTPEVTSVSVSHIGTGEVARDGDISFNVNVSGLGNPDLGVTWSIVEGSSYVPAYGNTGFLSNTNTLRVDPAQNPGTIRVRATSVATPTQWGEVIVTVRRPIASALTISSDETLVAGRGDSLDLAANTSITVSGEWNPQDDVRWHFGNDVLTTPLGSTITPEGYLVISASEYPSTLTVTATATGTINDGNPSGTIQVQIPTATGVTLNPATLSGLRRGETPDLASLVSATVSGNHNPDQGVAWSFAGGSMTSPSGLSTITAEGVLTIHMNEPNDSLPVEARANGARNINTGSAALSVSILARPTSISLSSPGGTGAFTRGAPPRPFAANVNSTFGGTVPQDVEWSISGHSGLGTGISATGTLSVSGREPLATGQIMVRATARGYPDVYDEVQIAITGQMLVGPWRTVRVGIDHTMAITWEGELWTWGRNEFGQLGLNVGGTLPLPESANRNTPRQVVGESNWDYVSGGWAHTIALRTDGTIWGAGGIWASNHGTIANRLIDLGRNLETGRIGDWSDWVTIHATHSAIFGTRADGSLWAWGANNGGMLGVGNDNNQTAPTQVLVLDADGNALSAQPRWVFVTGGQNHALAITEDGRLFGWGSNSTGQLGGNPAEFTGSNSPVPILDPGLRWDTVAAGHGWPNAPWSAGITDQGHLWTWGHNNSGRLGRGHADGGGTGGNPAAHAHAPERVGGSGAFFRTINMNNTAHGVAIDTQGRLWTWGRNSHGQLGRAGASISDDVNNVGTSTHWTPTVVTAGKDGVNFPIVDDGRPREWINSIAGGSFSLAIDSDGRMWAWGHNAYGQLGLNNIIAQDTPVEITHGPQDSPRGVMLEALRLDAQRSRR